MWFYYNPIITDPNAEDNRFATPVKGDMKGKIQYSPDMVAKNITGSVKLMCDVEVNGYTSNCHVAQSSGYQSFDQEALCYMKHAHYHPSLKNGVPFKEYGHHYTVDFKLD